MKEILKNLIRKLVGIKDTPQKIALGFAIGVFWGVFPTVGIGTILAIAVAALFKANKISAVAGSLFGLPIFGMIYTIISVFIGGLILGNELTDIMLLIKDIREFGWKHIMKYAITSYSLGIVTLSFTLSFIAYISLLAIIKKYKK